MAHDVFISCSSKDKSVADAACSRLEAAHIRCWIAPRDILPGREWGASIIEGIAAAKIMVLIFSRHTNESPQVLREVTRAVSQAQVVVPFRIDDVVPEGSLEYFLSTPHWLDAMTPPLERHLEYLVEVVEGLLARPAPVAGSELDEAVAPGAAIRPPLVPPPPPTPSVTLPRPAAAGAPRQLETVGSRPEQSPVAGGSSRPLPTPDAASGLASQSHPGSGSAGPTAPTGWRSPRARVAAVVAGVIVIAIVGVAVGTGSSHRAPLGQAASTTADQTRSSTFPTSISSPTSTTRPTGTTVSAGPPPTTDANGYYPDCVSDACRALAATLPVPMAAANVFLPKTAFCQERSPDFLHANNFSEREFLRCHTTQDPIFIYLFTFADAPSRVDVYNTDLARFKVSIPAGATFCGATSFCQEYFDNGQGVVFSYYDAPSQWQWIEWYKATDLQIVEVAFQTAQPRYSQAYQLFSNFCQSADCRNFWENFRL